MDSVYIAQTVNDTIRDTVVTAAQSGSIETVLWTIAAILSTITMTIAIVDFANTP